MLVKDLLEERDHHSIGHPVLVFHHPVGGLVEKTKCIVHCLHEHLLQPVRSFHRQLDVALVVEDDLFHRLLVGCCLPLLHWVTLGFRFCARSPLAMSTLSRDHGVLDPFWAGSSKSAANAFIEVLR